MQRNLAIAEKLLTDRRLCFGKSVYNPEVLGIFRTYFNYCEVGHDRKTPAMRLGPWPGRAGRHRLLHPRAARAPPGGPGCPYNRDAAARSFVSQAVNFRPTIPARMRPTQTSLATVAGSPKRAMPRTTVPTAPMPVQTAYAVPTGKVRNARPSNPMLTTIAATVQTVGQNRVNPSVYFRPIAQPTSNRPAITKTDQVIEQLPGAYAPEVRVVPGR
jgi:hypothetical protein